MPLESKVSPLFLQHVVVLCENAIKNLKMAMVASENCL